MARGHTHREIGEHLYIAEKTVENHVRNILGKLRLNRRQELVRYALEHGIERPVRRPPGPRPVTGTVPGHGRDGSGVA